MGKSSVVNLERITFIKKKSIWKRETTYGENRGVHFIGKVTKLLTNGINFNSFSSRKLMQSGTLKWFTISSKLSIIIEIEFFSP